MLSEIDKEEFLRSKTHCGSPDLVLESDLCDLPVDEHVLQGGWTCFAWWYVWSFYCDSL